VDLVDDLPARTHHTTGQLASQLLTELANITTARARRADSAARELNRPPPSTRWTRTLTTQATTLDRAAAPTKRSPPTSPAPGPPTTRPSTTRPPPTSTSINSPPAEPSRTPPAAQQNTLADQDLTEARAAIAAVNTVPTRRPTPVAPTGPAGHRPAPTRGAQPTTRPPSR